jgi:hypothetical protein
MAAPYRVDEPGLPPPWVAIMDPNTQRKYYWNPNTNTTTYDAPVAPAPGGYDGGRGGYDGGRGGHHQPAHQQQAPAAATYQACAAAS